MSYNGRRPSFSSRGKSNQNFTRINTRIQATKIRLVDEEGEQLGVVDIQIGLEKAKEKGMDLVEVASNVDPPVCRIIDYAKYKYDQKKKQKLAKKKQHTSHLKEVRYKPKIEEHDYQVKLRHVRDFLSDKDTVRIQLRFRGRENAHKELGLELLNRISADVSDLGEMESRPKAMGKIVIMTLVPKSG